MPLLIVGGGLFGSLAATYARRHGIETRVFDTGLPGAASAAAAGLFCEAWAGRKFAAHYRDAMAVLTTLYPIREVILRRADGRAETLGCVPPRLILEPKPIRESVTAVGDGWLEANGQRHEGPVYIAAGIWATHFAPDLEIVGKAGAAFLFPGESPPRTMAFDKGRQALAFPRDAGFTYFNDGTAEREYRDEHDHASLERAAAMGTTDAPTERLWGVRPYTSGGPIFRQLGQRTWLATGGRKLGTILGAAFARRLIEHELDH